MKNGSISDGKLNDICKSLKEVHFVSKEDRLWVREFNKQSLTTKKQIVRLLEREQSKSIIKGMHQLKDSISVPYLGRFSIKKLRKKYIQYCRDNPDVPIEEVAALIKQEYYDKLKEKKKNQRKKKELNLSKVKNEISSVT